MNTVNTLLSFDEMYADKKFYRLIFPYKNSEYPIKQNLELINALYKKYLKAREVTDNPKRKDIFDYWHFMDKGFYLERGYSPEEAEKLIQIKVDKRKQTFEKKSPEEIKEIAFKKNVFNFDNIKRIYPNLTDDDIHSLIKNRKSRSKSLLNKLRLQPTDKTKNHFCKEYYIAKGYSDSEAQEILSKNAANRKISVIMEKYGLTEKEAKLKQQEIINKGLKNYYKRPIEERTKINIRRTRFNKLYSKRSLKVLNRLITYLKDLSSDFKKFQYLLGDNEVHLIDTSSGKIRYYDLCIPECKIIVEYNGHLYHPTSRDTHLGDGKVIKVKDSNENDDLKYRIAMENGYKVFYLYEIPNKLLEEYQQAKNLANIIYEYYINERNR